VESLIQEAYLRFMSGKAWPADPITGIEVPSISNRLLHQSIQGGPGWIASDRYTIEAKAAGPETQEMMRGPMMQALLEDRFRLKIHRETRDVPVYALTVGKDGPKLQSMKPGSCVRIDFTNGPPPPPGQGQTFCGMFRGVGANGGMDTYGQTMAQLCRQFSVWLDRDVVNRTGIAGAFDIHLALSIADVMTTGRGSGALGLSGDPAPPTTPPDPLGAISAAVQKLGLKLAPAKEPGEFLVIDHVERPSEN
jgi:uncharacterized protein (TIGR03435 family)